MFEFSIDESAIACIKAVAVGDAMGKMTEGYWPEEVLTHYGGYLQGFRQLFQPKSRFTWGCAEVTDDTRFALIIAESIMEKSHVVRQDIIQRILNDKTKIKGWPGWEDFSKATLLGEDEIAEFAKWRDRNGAPMRVSLIGIINRPKNLEKIVRDMESAARLGECLAPAQVELACSFICLNVNLA